MSDSPAAPLLSSSNPQSLNCLAPLSAPLLPQPLQTLEGETDLESDGSFAVVQKVRVMGSTPATQIPQERGREKGEWGRKWSLGEEKEMRERKLMRAAENNDFERCRDLLDSDELLNPNYIDPSTGLTPLHRAAQLGFIQVCEIMLDYGKRVNIDARTYLSQTPLHLAVLSGHKAVVQLLIRAGIDLNATDHEGNTALHMAVSAGFIDIITVLLLKSADLSVLNNSSQRAIDLAQGNTLSPFTQNARSKQFLPSSALQQVQILSSRKDQVSHMLGQVEFGLGPRSESTPELEQSEAGVRPSVLDFEALQELGKGSFGEVFLVQKRDSGCRYAMKVLRKDKIIGQNLLKYALTERNVLSYVEHPFIVKLHYAFQTSEKLFLILDYCSGGDMGWHLQREKRFNEYRARIYMCEIILALEDLHKRNIVFRDLKPDNVLLDEDGHVRLTDFGLSKENLQENQLSKSFCGSVAYLAPEMLTRTGHGRAVDWYLLGVLMYEMLVGQPPYFAPSKEQLFHNIQRGKLKLPAFVSQEAKSLLIDVGPI